MENHAFGDTTIGVERIDANEAKVIIKGETVCWISRSDTDKMIAELQEVISKYRI